MATIKKTYPTEHAEQVRVVEHLKSLGVLYYAVPNGGLRHKAVAVNLVKEGVMSGVPDLVIPEPRGKYHGLYIEMKRVRGSRVSEDQVRWGEALKERGYAFHIAYGADEAIDLICTYLKEA